MKLNGALKPRQGASKQGSSPGAVLKEYRVKRYFKVNENVVKGLPLNGRDEKNKNTTENNVINRNNIFINNQQQPAAVTPLSQQLDPEWKFGQIFSSSISINSSRSLSRNNISTLKNIERQIFSTTSTTAAQKKSSQTTNLASIIWTVCRNNTKNILQKLSPATVAAAEALAVAAKELNKKKANIEIDLKQRTAANFSNITTRQINNTKLNEKGTNENKTNNIKGDGDGNDNRKIKQVKSSVDTSNKSLNNKNNRSPPQKEVNKFLFNPKTNECLILRLFIQLKLLLFSMFSDAIKPLNGNPFTTHCVGSGKAIIVVGYRFHCILAGYNLAKTMRASKFLERISFKNAGGVKTSIALCMVIYAATAVLLPHPVVGDDGDTFFPINGLETTTPEFDYASRGQKKFGDKCENTLECGFPGSICDPKKKSCQCTEDLPVTNHIDKCGKEAAVNESCFFNEQCEVKYFQTECRDQRCVCRFDMTPVWLKDGSVDCKGRGDKKGPETYIDPAMIGVLVGMALMFIIICVVLRLFSQARWHENRTIFNTPNPRLMNVSLLRESKHGQERRGSRMSVRAPSRQPSMASLRPHSPNPSLGKTGSRSNSHGSNASATSLRSTRSNSVSPAGITVLNNSHHERKGSTYQPHQHQHSQQQQQKLKALHQQEEDQQHLTPTNITSNPVAETVTVEIIEPEK